MFVVAQSGRDHNAHQWHHRDQQPGECARDVLFGAGEEEPWRRDLDPANASSGIHLLPIPRNPPRAKTTGIRTSAATPVRTKTRVPGEISPTATRIRMY